MIRVRRVLCDVLPKQGWTELPESEAHHVGRVLRLADGEEIEVLDGLGESVFGKIRRKGKALGVEEVRPGRSEPKPHRELIAEISVLKGPAMEWLVEKLTEIGVHTVVPIWTGLGVVQAKAKSDADWVARWQGISDQTLKQCGRLHRLTVEAPRTISDLLTSPVSGGSRLVFDPRGTRRLRDVPLSSNVRFTVGPEGGFSEVELSMLLDRAPPGEALTLGTHTLRAETAGICIAAYLLLA